MGSTGERLRTIGLIKKMIEPLDPPVRRFENSIRSTPLRILISVLISARTKDEVTMGASARLFNEADTPGKILSLGEEKISRLIYPVGFYRQKARNIMKIAEHLSETGGHIPSEMDRLTSLPGVGRKTANLVRALAFGIPSISVDIHVFRISKRLGWAAGDTPDAVEEELKFMFPEDAWNDINQTLVGFGQTICKPVNPSCEICTVSPVCNYFTSQSTAK